MITKNRLNIVLRLSLAIILLQTLYFKFTAATESVFIFSSLGMEPWGRIGAGLAELILSIMLFIPRTAALGAFFTAGMMVNIVAIHLLFLGFEIAGDHGLLFGLAVYCLFAALVSCFNQKEELISIYNRILKRN